MTLLDGSPVCHRVPKPSTLRVMARPHGEFGRFIRAHNAHYLR